jgi:hypothetical protein
MADTHDASAATSGRTARAAQTAEADGPQPARITIVDPDAALPFLTDDAPEPVLRDLVAVATDRLVYADAASDRYYAFDSAEDFGGGPARGYTGSIGSLTVFEGGRRDEDILYRVDNFEIGLERFLRGDLAQTPGAIDAELFGGVNAIRAAGDTINGNVAGATGTPDMPDTIEGRADATDTLRLAGRAADYGGEGTVEDFAITKDGGGFAARVVDVETLAFTDDPAPISVEEFLNPLTEVSLSVDDITVQEGDTGTTPATFTLALSEPVNRQVTIDVATVAETASAETDFTPLETTVTLAAGEATASVTVDVAGDTEVEPDETFTLNLTNASEGVTLDTETATATIANDDAEPPDELIDTQAADNVTGTDQDETLVLIADGQGDTFDAAGEVEGDTLDLSNLPTGQFGEDSAFVSLIEGIAVTPVSGTDSIANFERVIGTDAADTIGGDGGANVLDGGPGDDTIDGLGGDDRIPLDNGANAVAGGDGGDTFVLTLPAAAEGAAGRDVVGDFNAAEGDRFLVDLSGLELPADFQAVTAVRPDLAVPQAADRVADFFVEASDGPQPAVAVVQDVVQEVGGSLARLFIDANLDGSFYGVPTAESSADVVVDLVGGVDATGIGPDALTFLTG